MGNKKVYSKPILESETFIPQTYIANCGDSGTIYKFTCDAGGGVSGNVYLETNGVEGLQTDREWIQTGRYPWDGYWQRADQSLGGYHACNISHAADSNSDFLKGYYQPYGSDRAIDVIVWRGPNDDNVHCTTNLNQNSWETVKS